MPGFYRGLDVYVQPSLSAEGLPITILEAMGAGLPVVATDVAGAPEAIRDGEDGFVVPPGDITLLTRRLEELIVNPELRRELGNKAKQRLKAEFAMETMANKVLDCYRDIITHRF
jgi:glycosyltransferase involved in cell wall biosynthesis